MSRESEYQNEAIRHTMQVIMTGDGWATEKFTLAIDELLPEGVRCSITLKKHGHTFIVRSVFGHGLSHVSIYQQCEQMLHCMASSFRSLKWGYTGF